MKRNFDRVLSRNEFKKTGSSSVCNMHMYRALSPLVAIEVQVIGELL